jgi:uncharacterized protein (TIGR02246 family)
MSKEAASLVAGAKQWAKNYGNYPNGEEGHVLTAPLRVRAAWAANDADAFADMFIDNGSMLVGDNQLTSREEIRSYMKDAFDGGFRGSQLVEEPREIRLLTDSVAVAIMEGGIVRDGRESVDPNDEARSMFVLVKRDGDWRVAVRQSSPIKG